MPSPSSLTRRTLLRTSAGAFLAFGVGARAGAQDIGRARFARWMQWTQILGAEWNIRNAYTIRAFPSDATALVLKWNAFPSSAISLVSVPDPGGLMAYRMFRSYHERPSTPLATNIDIVEDFCWLERTRLHENVWTEGWPDAAKPWEGFTAASNATTIPLPAAGCLLWIQPTMDIPEEHHKNQLILNGALASHPLSTLINAMIDQDLFVAASVQAPDRLLQGTNLHSSHQSTLVRLADRPDLPFPSVYMRLLLIENSDGQNQG